MIQPMNAIPGNMLAFRATNEVTKADFEEVILPAVEALIAERGELNYLLQLDTTNKQDTTASWWKEAMLGLQTFTQWKRLAIVSDANGIQFFTDLFGPLLPGEFRGYQPEELNVAVEWVRGRG